jgi:tetratricopeptide (TPR) repeat protein
MRRDLFNRFGVLLISALFFCLIYSNLFAAEVISETATLLETAKKAWEAGDLEISGNLYRKIITDSPSTIEAIIAYQDLAIQGIQSKRSADVESFVETLKVKYAKFPETADALHSVAQHYQWNGQPEQAINLYRYNSSTYTDTKKGMWSQGAIVHYYIEHKDFTNAQKEIDVMLERFKEQPTLPQEIHQFAEKYRTTGESDRALELHKFNATHSPISSVYTMWSQGGMVHHYIRQKDFVSAKQACDTMIERFSEQPALPQELHLIAEMYKGAGKIDMALELHQFNASHSPVSSMYTMQSQGALIHYYIEQKDFYPAEYEYNNLLSRFKDQPTLPYEIYQYALKYNSVGNSEKALQLHRYNSEHSPASSLYAMQSQGSIVHYYIEHKDFANAQKEFAVMLGRFKDQETLPQEIHLYATKYLSVGETEKALELYRFNAMNFPVSAKHTMWSYGAMIHYYIEHKDFTNAQKEYAIMLDRFKDQPAFPQEICQFADKYRQYGQYEQARSLCLYGLNTYPNCSWRNDFHKVMIKTYLAENNFDRAASISSELIAGCAGSPVYVKTVIDLGHIYRECKQWAKSIEYYQLAQNKAELSEDKLEAYTGIARVALWMDNNTKFQDTLNIILSQYGQEKNYYHSMYVIGEECYFKAETLRKETNTDQSKALSMKALQIWEPLVAQAPNGDNLSDLLYCIGCGYAQLQEYEKAIPYYEQVVQQWPDSDPGRIALTLIEKYLSRVTSEESNYIEQKQQQLESSYLTIIERYPNSKCAPESLYKLGERCFKQERYSESIQYFLRFIEKMPNDNRIPTALSAVGEAYEKTGDMAKAKEVYSKLLQQIKSGSVYEEIQQKLQSL